MEWGLFLSLLVAGLLHEGMHLLSLFLSGGRLRSLRITLTGAQIVTEQGCMGYGGELLSILAGPGINLLLSVLLAGRGEEWELFAAVNFALGVFNLLPIPGLDGWRVGKLLFLMLKSNSGE